MSHRRPLSDVEYADDVALFHAHHPSLQIIVNALELVAPKYGLHMNFLKAVHMPCACAHNPPVIVLRNGHKVPHVHGYSYLGTIISADSSPHDAINARLGESTAMFRITAGTPMIAEKTYSIKNNFDNHTFQVKALEQKQNIVAMSNDERE